jgi:hypothetical protein
MTIPQQNRGLMDEYPVDDFVFPDGFSDRAFPGGAAD